MSFPRQIICGNHTFYNKFLFIEKPTRKEQKKILELESSFKIPVDNSKIIALIIGIVLIIVFFPK